MGRIEAPGVCSTRPLVIFAILAGVSILLFDRTAMDEPQPRCRRRWFQYSLRTLMLFMFACVTASAWVGWELAKTRRERTAVAKIESCGGEAWDHKMTGPPWMTRHFRRVEGVWFVDTPTDAGLGQLKQLTCLEALIFTDTQVTDAGLVHLKRLASLKRLDLDNTQVTDAGLIHLKELTDLEELQLAGTQVTDAGLEQLTGPFELERLTLGGIQITDAGLVHLEGLTSLYTLVLGTSPVTDTGVEKLQQVLPNCDIRCHPATEEP